MTRAVPPGVDDIRQAVRRHARATGDLARAEAALTELSRVSWDANGDAVLPEDVPPASRDAAIALADILIAGGQEKRARGLLATIIGRWRHEVGALKRPELWYFSDHPIALALYGDREAALAMLERGVAHDRLMGRALFRLTDPAYAALRAEPRFQAVVQTSRVRIEKQRRELDRLRAEGLVPDRSQGSESPSR